MNSLRPIPAASYQCISARRTERSGSLTRAIPLHLRQRPRPYILRNRAISRSSPCGERLDLRNIAQNFEVHPAIVANPCNSVNEAALGCRSVPAGRLRQHAVVRREKFRTIQILHKDVAPTRRQNPPRRDDLRRDGGAAGAAPRRHGVVASAELVVILAAVQANTIHTARALIWRTG